MIWFEDMFRNLFFLIDKVVYFLIGLIYELFITLSQVNINQDIVEEFASRIYVLLGIFMLFRLAFSLITFLINPDNLKEAKTGGGALVKNVFKCIILIALVPTIFNEAFKLQKRILDEDIIGQIILGKPLITEEIKESDITPGKEMGFTVFSAFFTPNYDNCSNPVTVVGGLASINTECNGFTGSAAEAYLNAFNSRDISKLDAAINLKKSDNSYVFTYRPIVSTIAGGFTAYILLIFCIDIALRIVKLAFLQIIAPIPVISSIDPKQGTDGIFKKWYTTCFKTFADVFIRLTAIYFALYMIGLLTAGEYSKAFTINGKPLGLIEIVFVIFGLLMFAKQLPDLLKDLLGVDLKGNFTLNPVKKISDTSPFAAAALGMGAGAIGGWMSNYNARRDAGGGRVRSALKALQGAGSGLFRGARAGYDSKGSKLFSSSFSAAGKSGQNVTDKLEAKEAGVRFRDKMAASFNTAMPGRKTASQQTEEKLKNLDKIASSSKAIKDRVRSEWVKTNPTDASVSQDIKDKLEEYNNAKAHVELLKSQSLNRKDYNTEGEYQAALKKLAEQISTEENALIKTEEDGMALWYRDNKNDSVIQTSIGEMEQAAKLAEQSIDTSDYKNMKTSGKNAEGVAAGLRTSPEYQRDIAATNYVNRNGNNGSNK